MESTKPAPPNEGVIQQAALLAVKIVEKRPISEEDRLLIMPSARFLDPDTLSELLQWDFDRYAILGPTDSPPIFKEYSLMPDDVDTFSLKTLFYQPDAETFYCMVTNGHDSGVLLILINGDWNVGAVIGVSELVQRLMAKGFTSYEKWTPGSFEEIDDDSNVSDYWAQYDQVGSEDEKGQPQPERMQVAAPPRHHADNIEPSSLAVFVRRHALSFVKDLYLLYKGHEASTEEFATQLFALGAANSSYRGKTFAKQPKFASLEDYTKRAVQNEIKLYFHCNLTEAQFFMDVELALVDIDFQILHHLNIA